MFDKYIQTKTYSVTVSLASLEKHIDADLRNILLKELHIDSLTGAYLQVDLVNEGIIFYTVQISEV